jgi:hypothetical protein
VNSDSQKKIVVLATGGTIAGKAAHASDNIGYTAAQLGVDDLLAAVPGLPGVLNGHQVLCEQVAQVDSKDMDFALWRLLAQRVQHYLAREEVSAVVITHGTDTLEETAFFLHALVARRIAEQQAGGFDLCHAAGHRVEPGRSIKSAGCHVLRNEPGCTRRCGGVCRQRPCGA